MEKSQALKQLDVTLEVINLALTTGTQDEIDLIGEIQVCRCCVSTLKDET